MKYPLTEAIREYPFKVLVVGNLNGSLDALSAVLGKEDFLLFTASSLSQCAVKMLKTRPDAIFIVDTVLKKDDDLTYLYSLLRYSIIPAFIISQKDPCNFGIQEVGVAGNLIVKQLNKYYSIVKRVENAFGLNQNQGLIRQE
jgi:hypothetical protein